MSYIGNICKVLTLFIYTYLSLFMPIKISVNLKKKKKKKKKKLNFFPQWSKLIPGINSWNSYFLTALKKIQILTILKRSKNQTLILI